MSKLLEVGIWRLSISTQGFFVVSTANIFDLYDSTSATSKTVEHISLKTYGKLNLFNLLLLNSTMCFTAIEVKHAVPVEALKVRGWSTKIASSN